MLCIGSLEHRHTHLLSGRSCAGNCSGGVLFKIKVDLDYVDSLEKKKEQNFVTPSLFCPYPQRFSFSIQHPHKEVDLSAAKSSPHCTLCSL